MQKRFTKIRQIMTGLIVLLFSIPQFAFAFNFTTSPLIVDEKAKQRDILKETVVLTNNTERKLNIYVTVYNVDNIEGEQDFVHRTKTDITASLAHWIEITRGVIELDPGETKRIPYLIQVHLDAQPGVYHADMIFREGSTYAEAEARADGPTVSINVEVLDDAKERLQLGVFAPDETFFSGKIASFTYLLENIGNRSVAPSGKVRIFNRKGEEVATINANEKDSLLLPEASSQLSAVWNTDGKFGRYKALLDLEYGDKQRGTIQDTIFFWVIPWKQILSLFGGLCLILVMITYIMYDRYGLGKQRSPRLSPVPVDRKGVRTAPQILARNRVSTRISRSTARYDPRSKPKTGVIVQSLNTEARIASLKSFGRRSSSSQVRTATKRQSQSHPRNATSVVQLKKREKQKSVSGHIVLLKKKNN